MGPNGGIVSDLLCSTTSAVSTCNHMTRGTCSLSLVLSVQPYSHQNICAEGLTSTYPQSSSGITGALDWALQMNRRSPNTAAKDAISYRQMLIQQNNNVMSHAHLYVVNIEVGVAH